MRESLGGSLLFNLVIVFTSIVILVFVSIMAYSKAYRVKNRIIEVVEKSSLYSGSVDYINEELERMGYGTTSNKKCDSYNLNNTSYNYCIYAIDNTFTVGKRISLPNGQQYTVKNGETLKDIAKKYNQKEEDILRVNKISRYGGYYYKVVTYATFQFPIIGDLINIKVEGETKTLGRSYDY